MYVPAHFAAGNPDTIAAFIKENAFGILVSSVDGAPFATHVPFAIAATVPHLILRAHVARANPQWKTIESGPVMAIFSGAHAHVSAAWYEEPEKTVPTWDYAAVHCSGRARIVDAEQTREILAQLVREHEGPDGWAMESADSESLDGMQRAITGIEIAVTKIDAQFKYSQNRSDEDRRRVLERLESSSSCMDRRLAAEMTRFYAATFPNRLPRETRILE